MTNKVEIRIAELYAGDEHHVIETSGVGSCIIIIVHDKEARVGGMAHAILPHAPENAMPFRAADDGGKHFVKYADEAVDTLVKEVEAIGGKREHCVAKLVGGARMFSLLAGDKYGIGWENTESARGRLQALKIPIGTEVVGGTVGRNVHFDCGTGLVEVTTRV